nr:endoribonuclease Dicer homolog 3a-like [Tanacetum cinerariifolium]
MESLEEEQDTITTNMLRKRSFQTMMNDSFLNITPHRFDVFKVAMQQKNVAYLDTGGDGKTMIIKDIAVNLKKQPPPCQNQLIIFLAPTCDLVEQEITNRLRAEIFSKKTNVKFSQFLETTSGFFLMALYLMRRSFRVLRSFSGQFLDEDLASYHMFLLHY